MKNQKGITLVALIITIIVMLILAGVSISLVVGENGVLTQANEAGDSTKYAEAKQQVQLAMANLLMDYYADTQKGDEVYTNDSLKTKIENEGGKNVTVTSAASEWKDGGTIKVTVSGENFEIKLDTKAGYPYQATEIK